MEKGEKKTTSKKIPEDDWKRLEKWHIGRANFP